jgi:hypothetical protein
VNGTVIRCRRGGGRGGFTHSPLLYIKFLTVQIFTTDIWLGLITASGFKNPAFYVDPDPIQNGTKASKTNSVAQVLKYRNAHYRLAKAISKDFLR